MLGSLGLSIALEHEQSDALGAPGEGRCGQGTWAGRQAAKQGTVPLCQGLTNRSSGTNAAP